MSKKYNSFIFTHIPKCGGTSFRSFINDAAIQSKISLDKIYIPGSNGLGNDKNLSQLSEKELQKVRAKELVIITDHSRYNDHQRFGLEVNKPFYYTIFREPVSRFISHYNFFYYKNNYDGLGGVSLNDLEEDKLCELLAKLSNVQTNYVSNVKMPKVMGNENILKIAKYNLAFEYGSFGILEDIGTSIEVLREKSPEWLKIPTSFPIKNSNKGKTNLNDEVIEKIQEYNSMDMNLYAFAVKLFKQKIDKPTHLENQQNTVDVKLSQLAQ